MSADGSTRACSPCAARSPRISRAKKPPSWRIWQYVIATDTLSPVIDPVIDPDPATVNDVSPHYLADGRIVFSSTRQTTVAGRTAQRGVPAVLLRQDEARRRAGVRARGDERRRHRHPPDLLQPEPRPRRDRAAERARAVEPLGQRAGRRRQMSLYSSNPDGTDLELYYGANSHLTGTWRRHHHSHGDRVRASARDAERQHHGADPPVHRRRRRRQPGARSTASTTWRTPSRWPRLSPRPTPARRRRRPRRSTNIYTIPGPSPGGRFNSAYPLWDGTGRILVSWSECRLLDHHADTADHRALHHQRARQPHGADAHCRSIASGCSIPAQDTMMPIVAPVEGVMVTDVVPPQPEARAQHHPRHGADRDRRETFASSGVGVIDIRSVYDIDGCRESGHGAPVSIATVADPAQTPVSSRARRASSVWRSRCRSPTRRSSTSPAPPSAPATT